MLNKKRMLSLMLSAALSLTVPISAYAETGTAVDGPITTATEEAETAEEQPAASPEETVPEQSGETPSAEPDVTDPAESSEETPGTDPENPEEANPAGGEEETSETDPENPETADPADGEEKTLKDGEETVEEDNDEDKVALSKVTFTSEQEITLSVSSAEGAVDPATDEELAAYEESRSSEDGEEESSDAEESPAATFTAVYLLGPGEYTYSASAEGCTPIENRTFEVAEESSEFTINVTLESEAELPYGFKGMPEGYVLSADEIAAKKELEENNVAETIKGLVPGEDYVEGEVIFLSDDASYVDMMAAAYSAELKSYSYEVAVLTLTTATVEEAVTAAADPSVPLPAVEPNYIRHSEPVETCSGYSHYYTADADSVPELQGWKLWYDSAADPDPYLTDPTDANYQYFHDIVNTYEAWGVSTGSGVYVGVVDSGVAAHEDIDELEVLPTSLGTDNLTDHGTHVAGIIAADRDNGKGGAGIAPDAKIISARCLDGKGSGTTAQFIEALNAIRIDGRAWIVNMSLGDPVCYSMEYEALKQAIDSGITLVVSMGNDASNVLRFPGSYDLPGLISVGSITEAGTRSCFSSYGAWQDVTAPGTAIMSTVLNNGYEMKDGTSMSTPVVSGICALYMSAYGYTTPAEMEEIIKKATTNGVVDASKLFMSDTTAPNISVFNNTTVEYGSSIAITSASGAATADNGAFVYTIDGSYPSVKNGEVSGTTLKYDTETGIEVTSENGFTPGKKITIRAAAVSGMGVLGKAVTRTFTVGYAKAESVEILNAPMLLVAGKSATLEFRVLPAEAKQKVTWSIDSREGCSGTTIDKNGLLKTSAADSGSVTVMAETLNGEYVTAEIEVKRADPVSKLTLDCTRCTLTCTDSEVEQITLVPTAADKNGEVVAEQYEWKSSNENVATVEADGTVTAAGKGRAVITCTVLDGSKKTAKCTVTVSQLAETITISGQERIAPGKSATYKAEVLPASANNRKCVWSLGDAPDGVTISKAGVVKVPKTVKEGTIEIVAAAADESGITASKTIDIAPLATAIDLYIADGFKFNGGGYTTNPRTGALKTVTLWTLQTDNWNGEENTYTDNAIALKAVADVDDVPIIYSSSNTKVATVDVDGVVTAVAAGTAKVTCKALDGSGKCAQVTIKVIIPASGITVIPEIGVSKMASSFTGENRRFIAPGTTTGNTAALSSAFGKPSAAKIVWSYKVQVVEELADGITEKKRTDLEKKITEGKMVSLSQKGILRVKEDIAQYSGQYSIKIFVTAATTGDGTDLSDTVIYTVTSEAVQKLGLAKYYIVTNDGSDSTSGYFNKDEEPVTAATLIITDQWKSSHIALPVTVFTKGAGKLSVDCVVKSSNPSIAGGYYESAELTDKNGNVIYSGPAVSVYLNDENKKGSATITIYAGDGSGKKCSIKLIVK